MKVKIFPFFSNEPDKTSEQRILIKAIENSIYPKLLADDFKLFHQILEDIFPGYINLTSEPTKLEVSYICLNFLINNCINR